MIVAVPKETFAGERRVALIPAAVGPLVKAGLEVVVESGAGLEAGIPDGGYSDAGARITADRQEVFAADVVFQVRTPGTNPESGAADVERLRQGQVLIGMADPLGNPAITQAVADRGATLFALELLPRITRAQVMDVLSSQATVAGYRAVLLAAETLPKMFPMMMTAAGTIKPAKVFIMGVGVAGLQAIATARRLGAAVSANDIRPAVKEQVESLGAKFVQLELDVEAAEDKGGYAKEMGEEFLRKQRELITKVVAESDVVITTAAVPGKKAPILVTEEMVEGMSPGSVLVDLAAERGGNCALTQPGETVDRGGVKILGPTNLPAEIPYHASQMYAKNISAFLLNLVEDGKLKAFDLEDEIVRDTMITRDGRVVNPRVCEALGIEPPAVEEPAEVDPPGDTDDTGGDDEYQVAE